VSEVGRPEIYDYFDYRRYLADMRTYSQARLGLTERAFANKAGIRCSSYLGRVIRGTRSLTKATTKKISRGFELSKSEFEFLWALVEFSHAEGAAEQEAAYNKLLTFRGFKRIKYLEADKYEYFSHWYYPALLAAMTTHWAKRPLAEIASALGISEFKVQTALERLARIGLLEKEKGHWIATEMALDTATATKNLQVRSFHREMIQRALEAIDSIETDERELGSLTITLSEDDFLKVRDEVREFRKRLTAQYAKESRDESVYQLNLQFFPLMKLPK